MKFCVELVNRSGCRLGKLSGVKSNPEVLYETPLSLITTKRGSIPHLLKDVYHESFSKNSILCVPAQHFADQQDVLQAFKKGVASFASLPTHPVCVVVQDPAEATPAGYNQGTFVSTWTSAGRTKLSPQKYVDLVAEMAPDWYDALNDADTDAGASKKRVEKSKKNSLHFLQQCLKLHRGKEELKGVWIFAPLLGGLNPTERERWSACLGEEEEVDGFSLLGLHPNGAAAQLLPPSLLKECIQASLTGVPAAKPRQAQGAFSLPSMLALVECGVDVFDSSFAFLAAHRGAALSFPNTMDAILKSDSDFQASREASGDEDLPATDAGGGKSIANKKFRVEDETAAAMPLSSEDNEGEKKAEACREDDGGLGPRNYQLDLKEKKYARSASPLVPGCACYACSSFSRAYLHHLLAAREMLASVLLMVHNLHHWELFFETIRTAIRLDQFEHLQRFFSRLHDQSTQTRNHT